MRSVAVFEFDAANVYGTPIRGLAECAYDTLDGDPKLASAFTVKVNGKTTTDRLLEAVERRRGR